MMPLYTSGSLNEHFSLDQALFVPHWFSVRESDLDIQNCIFSPELDPHLQYIFTLTTTAMIQQGKMLSSTFVSNHQSHLY